MQNALKRVGIHKFAFEKIEVVEGDILRIDKNGEITKAEFKPAPHNYRFSTPCGWYDDDFEYLTVHEQLLITYCGCYGVDSEDVELLLEYGYTCDEIEEMLMDTNLLRETLQAIKFKDGESLYEQAYGGVF